MTSLLHVGNVMCRVYLDARRPYINVDVPQGVMIQMLESTAQEFYLHYFGLEICLRGF